MQAEPDNEPTSIEQTITVLAPDREAVARWLETCRLQSIAIPCSPTVEPANIAVSPRTSDLRGKRDV
jgi:hypothetical protein